MIETGIGVIEQVEKGLQPVFAELDRLCHKTTAKVMDAFAEAGLDESHFYSVSGYGHDDMGRHATDSVFAHAFGAEAACVRLQFVSGTHAIACMLKGALGTVTEKRLLSLTGAVYDTLEPVIGKRDATAQSLTRWGVEYDEIWPFEDNQLNIEVLDQSIEKIKYARVGLIQRSKGYDASRPSLTLVQVQALIERAKQINPEMIIVVDNCYGEFSHELEPVAVGADLMAGSLIKNPGGGIVATGGYVAGKATLVESAAECLTAPGIGTEGGFTFDSTRMLMQGLYLAPMVVKEALKSMRLFAGVFEQLGYCISPGLNDPQADIIQTIQLGSEQAVLDFCRVLQSASPVGSRLTPIPDVTPGYADAVVMAGGTFVFGSTIELSADAPMRDPYAVFLQGGLNYSHSRYVLQKMLTTGFVASH